MRRGRRYNTEPKLNIKKVVAVVIFIAVIIMFVFAIKELLNKSKTLDKIEVVSYYTVYTNENWGVIDSKGNIIIEPIYNEMIVIPNNKEDVFICTYDINYENNTYKTKVLNSKNEEQFKEYDLVEYIANYDKNNNLWYEDNVLKVQKDGKYGLIDFNGKEILKPEYEEITALTGIKNSLLIKTAAGFGVCDSEGNIQVTPNYTEIKAISKDYKDGFIVKNQEEKYGVIDFTNKTILKEKYDEIKDIYNDGKYVVKESGEYKLINKDSETILEENAVNIKEINGDNFVVEQEALYGLININGEIVLEAEYEVLEHVFSNYYIAKKAGKYGIIDSNGEEKIAFVYDNINYREEGIIEASKNEEIDSELYNTSFELKVKGIISSVENQKGYMRIRVEGEYKYYNFKFEEKELKEILNNNNLFLSKKDGKYGYVDNSGNVVVDYIYEDALEQNTAGFAAVKKDGLWGSIDKDGNEVIEPKYKLENNIIIDFIGKWHIAEDINAYYYTDI